MKDDLGNRIKENYEDRTRFSLPRRTYTLIRLDGKSFHTYTRGLEKPFDEGLFVDMDDAIINMLPQIQGAQFAYTQSDEISVLVTDFEKPTTDAWFDGNIQKITSVASSIITAEFNLLRWERSKQSSNISACKELVPAYFDARVFTIPDRTEVMNYFIWRNQDCAKNSVSMVAQSLFSHKELQGKNSPQMQEMMFKYHGVNWANYDQSKKNGRLIVKENYMAVEKVFNPLRTEFVGTRTRWISKPAWKFTEDMDTLKAMITDYV
jgi:tRNA(His) 5'-end guanylyltransferase